MSELIGDAAFSSVKCNGLTVDGVITAGGDINLKSNSLNAKFVAAHNTNGDFVRLEVSDTIVDESDNSVIQVPMAYYSFHTFDSDGAETITYSAKLTLDQNTAPTS